jgi:hypothetical protein
MSGELAEQEKEQEVIKRIKRLSKGSSADKIEAVNLIFKLSRMPAECQDILEELAGVAQTKEVRICVARNFTLDIKGMTAKHYFSLLMLLAKDPDKEVAYFAGLELQKFSQFDNLLRELSEAQRKMLEQLKTYSVPNIVAESGKSYSFILDNLGSQKNTLRELVTKTTSYYPGSELLSIEKKEGIPTESKADLLANRLRQCVPGRKQWDEYQDLCKDILVYCLIPPLLTPFEQSETRDGLHVRDLIFDIPHGVTGFWNYILIMYGMAIVVECKNYTEQLKENDMIVTSKYLDPDGLTSLGLILSRKGLHEHGRKGQEKAWRSNKKMILSLNDDDLLKMLELKANSDEPSKVIDRALRGFRSSLS